MKVSFLPLTLIGFLGFFTMTIAAPDAQEAASSSDRPQSTFGSDPEDPTNLLRGGIQKRREQKDSLIPYAPLGGLRDTLDKARDEIYEATNLKLGLTVNHLFQGLSDTVSGEDDWGTTTDLDFVGTWELVNRGKPTQGELFFGVEGRWDYGTTGPQDLGFVSLASAGGTANAFSEYVDPTFILRNLYWEQGGPEAGWAYRIGKITPDAILATSRHLTPVSTFLPNVGTGFFSMAVPDSGPGAAAVIFPNERLKAMALVSDANADRSEYGEITKGDFFRALEFGAKLAPMTEKAGFSKVTFWQIDSTGGEPSNASTGVEGQGVTVKLEQELTEDGKVIGILRWGKSWDDSAIFEEQAGAHLLFYDPPGPAGLTNDVVGVAANWVDSVVSGSRDEYNLEAFYRFPLFPGVDTRLSYQHVFDPALTREVDDASVFSVGFRIVF